MEREKKEANTLYHISHLHPLKLTQFHQEGPKPNCYACRLPCTDSALGCSPCCCFLHPSCARLPRTLRHSSHPSHDLTLRLYPAYSSGAFTCNACGGNGIAFCFHCPDCEFDLHLPCAGLPEELNHPSHPSHALTLIYEDASIGNGYVCDLCRELLPSTQWIYHCRPCDFGGHVDCFTSMKSPGGSGGGESQQPSPADPMVALMQSQQRLLMTALAADHARRCFDGADLSRRVTYVTHPSHSYTNLTSAMLMQQAQQMAMLSLNNSIHGNGGAGRSGASGGVSGGGGGGGGNEGSSDAKEN